MSASIEIKTADAMANFIFFLHITGVEVKVQEDKEFIDLLYEAITAMKIKPEWLRGTNVYPLLEQTFIRYNKQHIHNFMTRVHGKYSDLLSNTLLKPTPHFMAFCGSESLRPGGYMTKGDAYEYLMYQICIRRIKTQDDIIYLNDFLKDLFHLTSERITKDELIGLIDGLFETAA